MTNLTYNKLKYCFVYFTHRLARMGTVVTLSAALLAGNPLTTAMAATSVKPTMDQPTPSSTPTPKAPAAIYQIQTTKKLVALTFNINWGEKIPGPVLDVLQKKKVGKATFFLSGQWALQHPELAKRVKEMGFEIGNYGYSHENYTEFDDNWIDRQVHRAENALVQVTGSKPSLFRAPNGAFDTRVLTRLNGLGYTVIQWRIDSLDWKNPGVQSITGRVVSNTIPGDIVVLHANDSCKQTAEALPSIIDGLRKKGYTFTTVSELIAETDIKSRLE